MPEFCMIIITRKIFPRYFSWGGGGTCLPTPFSHAYAIRELIRTL